MPVESEKSPVSVWPAIVAVRLVAATENADVAVSMLTDTAAADRLTPVAVTVTAPTSAPVTSRRRDGQVPGQAGHRGEAPAE